MSVTYLKNVGVAILSKRDLCAGHKSSRVVTPYMWLYISYIPPFVIRVFKELIHVVSLGAFRMIKPLVKIPPTYAMFLAISSFNADIILSEGLEELNHTSLLHRQYRPQIRISKRTPNHQLDRLVIIEQPA